MKILFLSHNFYPDIGGIEVNSEILAEAFHKAGYEVRLMTWTLASDERSFPFRVIRNPSIGVLLQEHYWADVVYENNPCLRLAWPAVFFNKPSVIALRTWVSRTNGQINWQDKLKRKWLQRATEVIAVSSSIRNKCWPAATVIGNPYRGALFRVLPGVERNADFVFLGRLVSDKGADQAIKALYQLVNTRPKNNNVASKFSLTIIGEGPEKQRLEEMVIETGLKNHVSFTGALKGEALVRCLNQHRFLLVPSLWEEPFGNVALEGMACGCIPIVSNGGGLPDAVGSAGLTFQRGNVESLVNCIRSILDSPGLEAKLRGAAAEHLAAHRPEVVSQRYLNVIKKAFNQLN